jgi:TonB family protein
MATTPASEPHSTAGVHSDSILLAEVLLDLAERAQAYTNAAGVAIALTRGSDLLVRTSTGTAPEVGTTIPLADGFIGECFRTRKPLACRDIESDSRIGPVLRALRVRSLMAIPVCEVRDVRGMMLVITPLPNSFQPTHVSILMTLSDIIAAKLREHETAAEVAIHLFDEPEQIPEFSDESAADLSPMDSIMSFDVEPAWAPTTPAMAMAAAQGNAPSIFDPTPASSIFDPPVVTAPALSIFNPPVAAPPPAAVAPPPAAAPPPAIPEGVATPPSAMSKPPVVAPVPSVFENPAMPPPGAVEFEPVFAPLVPLVTKPPVVAPPAPVLPTPIPPVVTPSIIEPPAPFAIKAPLVTHPAPPALKPPVQAPAPPAVPNLGSPALPITPALAMMEEKIGFGERDPRLLTPSEDPGRFKRNRTFVATTIKASVPTTIATTIPKPTPVKPFVLVETAKPAPSDPAKLSTPVPAIIPMPAPALTSWETPPTSSAKRAWLVPVSAIAAVLVVAIGLWIHYATGKEAPAPVIPVPPVTAAAWPEVAPALPVPATSQPAAKATDSAKATKSAETQDTPPEEKHQASRPVIEIAASQAKPKQEPEPDIPAPKLDLPSRDTSIGNLSRVSVPLPAAPKSDLVPAALLTRVNPPYPFMARQLGISGVVLMIVTIAKDGSVSEVRVTAGAMQLRQAATEAVKQWRYKPAMLNGQAIESSAEVKVNFTR